MTLDEAVEDLTVCDADKLSVGLQDSDINSNLVELQQIISAPPWSPCPITAV
jgi:hypothetical protein